MYFRSNQKTIDDFSDKNIETYYNEGYVFTRIGKGAMDQTRSARIDLSKFELTSENRRILKKVENVSIAAASIPYVAYDWTIGKMAKDFYEARDAEFSANKIKELLTNKEKSNFTTLFIFTEASGAQAEALASSSTTQQSPAGYAISYESKNILHYSYPFYSGENKDLGLGMMLKTILWAKEQGKKYIYLGSLQRPSDTYKLQLSGIEWFDGSAWTTDLDKAKEILKNAN